MNTVIPDISYMREYKLLLMAKERQNLRKDFHNYLLERQWIDKNKLTSKGLQILQYYKYKLQLQLYLLLDNFSNNSPLDINLQLGINNDELAQLLEIAIDELAQLLEIAIAEKLLILKPEGYEIVPNNFRNSALLSWRTKLKKDFSLTYTPNL